MASVDKLDRIHRRQADKFSERRRELGRAALRTLSELGYARTSLREIAQNSEFSHGVLHYYFTDKLDLIICSVRDYKEHCATRYDEIVSKARTYDELVELFLAALAETLRDDAQTHRLWYDLRAQALFEPAFRSDVITIDKLLEEMIWRVIRRASILSGADILLSPAVIYAAFDGVFQKELLRFLAGEADAPAALKETLRAFFPACFAVAASANGVRFLAEASRGVMNSVARRNVRAKRAKAAPLAEKTVV
jgi:AcrR family transcriptional regulator